MSIYSEVSNNSTSTNINLLKILIKCYVVNPYVVLFNTRYDYSMQYDYSIPQSIPFFSLVLSLECNERKSTLPMKAGLCYSLLALPHKKERNG